MDPTTNARSDDGLVHGCERLPAFAPATVYTAAVRAAGFTWCMLFFTWKDGPRFHPPEDGAESRLERTSDHVTCFKCMAGELGSSATTLL